MRLSFVAATAAMLAVAAGANAQVIVGNSGISGPDGVVTASPGGVQYRWVSTAGGVAGAGQLAGVPGGIDGSSFTSSSFTAASGDTLKFYFNYITSDGAQFSDYAWANLIGTSTITLFSARTTPTGNTVPGFGLPPLLATLTPVTTPIIPGGPVFSPLGGNSGQCFSAGCGYTGWIKAEYTIMTAGTYQLAFGVTNTIDSAFDSALAWNGAVIGGNPIDPIPEPQSWMMLIAGFGLVGAAARRRRQAAVAA
jgi:hypothetical protein